MSFPNNSKNLDDPVYWKNAGNDFFNKNQYKEAIECYYKAIELNPEYIDAWNNLGYSFSKIGKTEEAEKCRDRIKQIKSNLSTEKKPINNPNNKKSHKFRILSAILVSIVAILIILSGASYFGIFNFAGTYKYIKPDDMTLVYHIENNIGVFSTSVSVMDRSLAENDIKSMKKMSEVTTKYCLNALNETTALDLSPKFSTINQEYIEYLKGYMTYFKKNEEWANAYSNGEYEKLSNFSNDGENARIQADIHFDKILNMLKKCEYRF